MSERYESFKDAVIVAGIGVASAAVGSTASACLSLAEDGGLPGLIKSDRASEAMMALGIGVTVASVINRRPGLFLKSSALSLGFTAINAGAGYIQKLATPPA